MDTLPRAAQASRLRVEATVEDDALVVTICGEADQSTRLQLRDGLAAVPRGYRRDVQLRLAGLEFCDVPAVEELLALAEEVQADGADVVVLDAPPWIRAMMKILDVGAVLKFDQQPVSR